MQKLPDGMSTQFFHAVLVLIVLRFRHDEQGKPSIGSQGYHNPASEKERQAIKTKWANKTNIFGYCTSARNQRNQEMARCRILLGMWVI